MVFTFYGLGKLLFSYLSLSRSMKPIAPYKYPSISLKLLFKKWISQQYEVLRVEKNSFQHLQKFCALSFSLYSIFHSTVVYLWTLFVQYYFLTYEI